MSSVRLTPTSYVVLGLVEACQPATPYDIKQVAALSVARFWSLAHTQLYAECERLAAAGLLDETREEGGRRRRVYRLTKAGERALGDWRADVGGTFIELRDLGILKLFFGADPQPLAEAQLAAHEARLADYLETAKLEMTDGMRLALESGIGHEREFIRFWRRVARPPAGGARGRRQSPP
jgi:DNA-binding PadR family transcriptional regulator